MPEERTLWLFFSENFSFARAVENPVSNNTSGSAAMVTTSLKKSAAYMIERPSGLNGFKI
jgi:hypothetical protein